MQDKLVKSHIYYIDLLRVFLTILVFYHHAAISFGASGGWFYYAKEGFSDSLRGIFSINMAIDQSYFMSLFFFISAFLMPRSYDKKGARLFIKDRVNRLVIPLMIYFFVINPLLIYFIWGKGWGFGLGPMWFVFTLILFEASYVIYRSLIKKGIRFNWQFPGIFPIICFILLMGFSAFAVRLVIPTGTDIMGLQLGYFPLYIGMYFLGLVAYRNDWLNALKMVNGYIWVTVVLFIVIPLFLLALKDCTDGNLLSGGWNQFAFAYALWEPVTCVGICYFLLVFSRTHLNRKWRFIEWLSKNTYAFYIIHPVILVGCTFMAESLPFSPLGRFAAVLVVGIPLCFVIGNLFKRAMDFLGINV